MKLGKLVSLLSMIVNKDLNYGLGEFTKCVDDGVMFKLIKNSTVYETYNSVEFAMRDGDYDINKYTNCYIGSPNRKILNKVHIDIGLLIKMVNNDITEDEFILLNV